MIDTTFLATSEKLWPSPNSTLGGPRSSSGMKRRKKASIASRPSLRAQVAARCLAALPMDGQRVAGLVVVGAQRGQPLVAHQHQEALLGEIGGCRRIEAGGAVLDGIEPVGRQGLRRA